MQNNYWGKIWRTVTSILPPAKNRRGKCTHCGACCQLPNGCLFLRFDSNGKSFCLMKRKLGFAFLNCQKYPRTVNEWLTRETCGYRFLNNNNNDDDD